MRLKPAMRAASMIIDDRLVGGRRVGIDDDDGSGVPAAPRFNSSAETVGAAEGHADLLTTYLPWPSTAR